MCVRESLYERDYACVCACVRAKETERVCGLLHGKGAL